MMWCSARNREWVAADSSSVVAVLSSVMLGFSNELVDYDPTKTLGIESANLNGRVGAVTAYEYTLRERLLTATRSRLTTRNDKLTGRTGSLNDRESLESHHLLTLWAT